MTGESIANSAAIWRRGIIVRLFECSDCSIGPSGAEEVVEGHFGLDVSIVLSGNEAIGRDKRNMKRLFASFAQVDGIVIPIEHKVDLRILMRAPVALPSPGVFARKHARNTELELDLADMVETEPLESKAAPYCRARAGRCCTP